MGRHAVTARLIGTVTCPSQQRVSRIAGLAGLAVAPDLRSAIITVTDHWESDIMVADGIR
jgi:hypothetical protein